MSDGVFTLNPNETFPQLSRPPVVEAVIHWQARAQKPLELDSLREILAQRFHQYATIAPIQRFGFLAKMESQPDALVVENQTKGFIGLRLVSSDGHFIIQFMRDGLAFSCTQAYTHWEPFTQAAKDAWRIYLEIAAPIEIQRLGVRFINHLANATPHTLADFLREPPTCPSNLPLKEFVYQSTFDVPQLPFGIRIIKMMQPSMPELQQSTGLFLDIDVFSTRAISNEPGELDPMLAQMRWLKNKVFFTLVTDAAVQSYR